MSVWVPWQFSGATSPSGGAVSVYSQMDREKEMLPALYLLSGLNTQSRVHPPPPPEISVMCVSAPNQTVCLWGTETVLYSVKSGLVP